jgi:hypothetical protein
MPDTKITALTAITTVDPAVDVLPIVDVSDTTMAASGTTKKITSNQILGAGGTATLASATITGNTTVATDAFAVRASDKKTFVGTAPISTAYKFFVTLGGTAGSIAEFTDGIGQSLTIDSAAGGLIVGNPNNGYLRFTINGTDRLYIDSSGKVGIGATPGYKLHVGGYSSANIAPDVAIVRSSSGTTNQSGPNLLFNDGTSTNNIVLQNTQGRFGIWNYGAGSWNERLSVDSSGNVGIGVVSSAGAGCLQLVSGINFPATQVASANANTLDDYEEGTWTATLKGSVSDPTTPVTVTGAYTKVGRLVTVTANFSNVNTTGASGNVTISGLPFSGAASSAGSAITFDLFTTSTTLACWNTGTNVAFYVSGGFIPATHSAGASRSLNITISYYV